MEQFCNKCGQSLPEGVAFCSNCGNQVGTPNVMVSSQEELARKSKNSIVKVIVATVAVIALILVVKKFIGSSNNSPKAVVNNFMSSLVNGDADQFFKSYPDEFLDEMSASEKKDFKSWIVDYKKYFKDLEYKVLDSEELDEYDLEEIQYEWEDYFKVKKAYLVKVECTNVLLGERTTDTIEFIVVKVGTKYYILYKEYL